MVYRGRRDECDFDFAGGGTAVGGSAYQDALKRVLKKGTVQPWLPHRSVAYNARAIPFILR